MVLLRAQAPEYVPPVPPPVRMSRPQSSSSSSTISFTVDRSANLEATISPSPPPVGGSALDPKASPFYPGTTGELVVQFQGTQGICYWISGFPGLWSVVSEEIPSDDSSQDQSDFEIDSPCYIGKDAYKQLPFSLDAKITVPMGPDVINRPVQGQKSSSEEYTQRIDEIYGFVQERLSSCGQRNENPLKHIIHEVLQVINDNPEAFLLKNREESIITIQEMKGKETHSMGYGNLTSGLSKLKDQAQDIEKLLEKNCLNQREKLDELLYDNNRVRVEAGLMLRKFELAIACLETDIAICKHQQIGDISTSKGDAGTSYTRTCNRPGAIFQFSDSPQWTESVRGQGGVLA